MKKFMLTILSFLGLGCVLPAFAGGISGVGKAARALYLITKNPDGAITVFGFLIDMLLACIPIAIISGITTLILKKVFNFNEDDSTSCFLVIGGFLLVVWALLYFFA